MTDTNAPVPKSHRAAKAHLETLGRLRAAVQAQTAAWAPNEPQDAAGTPPDPFTEDDQ